MFVKKLACAAAAALGLFAAPASAASFIGDNVIIRRFQNAGKLEFQTASTTVGSSWEFQDNFFRIDITANQVIFDPFSNFSIGDIFYQIEGLDFDDNPATANVIEGFSASQIYIPFPTPLNSSRATFTPQGHFKMSFANATGSGSGLATVTFGAAPPVVPEPATWAMMIAGFGLVGGAMRSARRRVSLQFAAG